MRRKPGNPFYCNPKDNYIHQQTIYKIFSVGDMHSLRGICVCVFSNCKTNEYPLSQPPRQWLLENTRDTLESQCLTFPFCVTDVFQSQGSFFSRGGPSETGKDFFLAARGNTVGSVAMSQPHAELIIGNWRTVPASQICLANVLPSNGVYSPTLGLSSSAAVLRSTSSITSWWDHEDSDI